MLAIDPRIGGRQVVLAKACKRCQKAKARLATRLVAFCAPQHVDSFRYSIIDVFTAPRVLQTKSCLRYVSFPPKVVIIKQTTPTQTDDYAGYAIRVFTIARQSGIACSSRALMRPCAGDVSQAGTKNLGKHVQARPTRDATLRWPNARQPIRRDVA